MARAALTGNGPPVFSGEALFTVAEDATAVGTVTADDPDRENVTCQLMPSPGGVLFQIDPVSAS